MKPVRTFNMLGDKAEVFADGATSAGSCVVLINYTEPGGGPPPHSHTKEDETFSALDEGIELLIDGKWIPARVGEVHFSPRGSVHTFRNKSKSLARLAVFAAPAGFETFMEEVTSLSPAKDLQKIIEIAGKHGISFHFDAAPAE